MAHPLRGEARLLGGAEIRVAPSSVSGSPSSTLKATAVMLSRPPARLAASTRLETAGAGCVDSVRIPLISSSLTIVGQAVAADQEDVAERAGKVIGRR